MTERDEKLFKALTNAQQRLNMLIAMTPTGDLRNEICDENIELHNLLITEFENNE